MMAMTLAEHERGELAESASTVAGWALDQPTLEALRRTTAGSAILQDVSDRLTRELVDHAYCLIRNAPTESDEELAALLGLVSTISAEGNGGELFYSVSRTLNEDEPSDLSKTGASFPFHSDSTYLARPHEMLGLGCVINDSDGGDSSLILADDIAAQVQSKAGSDALLALGEPVYPFFLRDPVVGHGVRRGPLLWRAGDEWHVRYRSDVLDALVPRFELDERHRSALDVLRSVLDDPAGEATIVIRLQPHDYLMIDNRRALHARTALGEGPRELRRSKGYFLRSEHGTII